MPRTVLYGSQVAQARVGFLGAGLIARYHAGSLAASGEAFAPAAVFDPDPARAERFGAELGYPVVGSEDEVLDRVDAVYVCTWTSEHPRLVASAAARGIHVFCEKPLATDLTGARAVAEVLAGSGVTHQVGLVLRRSPAFGLARALATEPAAGRVQAVVFRDDQFLPVRGMYGSNWRADVARAGAGTLLEHSIHDLDLLGWLAGSITAVTCRTAAFHALPGIEDVAAVLSAHDTGATSTLTSVWHDVDERPSLRRVELLCERRWIAVEGDWTGPVRWRSAGDADDTVLEGDALIAEARTRGARIGNPDGSFLRAIAAGAPAWPSASDALVAHRVADACYRSAAAGGATVDVLMA